MRTATAQNVNPVLSSLITLGEERVAELDRINQAIRILSDGTGVKVKVIGEHRANQRGGASFSPKMKTRMSDIMKGKWFLAKKKGWDSIKGISTEQALKWAAKAKAAHA